MGVVHVSHNTTILYNWLFLCNMILQVKGRLLFYKKLFAFIFLFGQNLLPHPPNVGVSVLNNIYVLRMLHGSAFAMKSTKMSSS